MIELDREALEQLLKQNRETVILFFYSPLCGTCNLARRMLQLTCEALPALQVHSCNINKLSDYATRWRISSVPSLLVLYDRKVLHTLYAFHSVPYLYEQLKSYAGSKEGSE